jgi:hypothetical protein
MPKPYIVLAVAGISAFVAIVAFYLPWMRFEINDTFFDNPDLECAQEPPQDAQSGLQMATDSGRIMYGPLDYGADDRDCIHLTATTFFLYIPVIGGVGTMLAAILLLRRQTLPGSRTAWFYIIGGSVGLVLLTINTVNLYRSEVVLDVTGSDIFQMRLLFGFWVSIVSFVILFLAGTGLLIQARQAPRPKKSRRK